MDGFNDMEVTPPTVLLEAESRVMSTPLCDPDQLGRLRAHLSHDSVLAVDPVLLPRASSWRSRADELLSAGRHLHEHQCEGLAGLLLLRDIFLLAPTGSGKSLVFQLPSLSEDLLTIVISPLQSLIRAQVRCLLF